METIVQCAHGSPRQVLELQDLPKPTLQDGEVLVRDEGYPPAQAPRGSSTTTAVGPERNAAQAS